MEWPGFRTRRERRLEARECRVEIRLTRPDALQVKGYMGVKFLSETYRWTRARETPQPLCPAST